MSDSTDAFTTTDLDHWLSRSSDNREASGNYDDWKLDPLKQVLANLNSAPRPLTIAGTKGKGSTAAFTESILLAHGQKVLTFTSPHVHHICERWRWNGEAVSLTVVQSVLASIAHAEEHAGQLNLSYFERCFCIAVALCQHYSVDYFICEVGLGGRLDCANALDAQVAGISHISHDHIHILGNTLEAIATEKCAIYRADAPLLFAPQSDAAETAIRRILTPEQHQLSQWLKPVTWPHPGMPGAHQSGNAALAVAMSQQVLRQHWDDNTAQQAVAQTHLEARCQCLTLKDGRRVLIDGAHNGPSVAATLATAESLLRPGWQIVLGVASDKLIDHIMAAIPSEMNVQRCGYNWPRARQQQQWPDAAQQWPWHDSIADFCQQHNDTHDLCITGSFYLAGESLDFLQENDLLA